MSQVRRVCVPAELEGQRVDNFLLRELRGVPRTLVYRLLRKGEVRINGGRIRQTYRLGAGDEVRLPPVRTGKAAEARPSDRVLQRLEAAILYEDERLLVLDKPSGLAVHGGSGLAYGVIEALRQLRDDTPCVDVAHRLDRDTSGCLIVAKRRSAHRTLHAHIREGRLEKRYCTLLRGRMSAARVPVDARLARRTGKGGESYMCVAVDGKPSRTVFHRREHLGDWTLAEAELLTGRMHQIRVHAAAIEQPVAGDTRYGDEHANRVLRDLGLRRLFLHASAIALPAVDGVPALAVEAPLAPELQAVIARLAEAYGRQHDQGVSTR